MTKDKGLNWMMKPGQYLRSITARSGFTALGFFIIVLVSNSCVLFNILAGVLQMFSDQVMYNLYGVNIFLDSFCIAFR